MRVLILTAAASLAAGFLLPANGALLLTAGVICVVGVWLLTGAERRAAR